MGLNNKYNFLFNINESLKPGETDKIAKIGLLTFTLLINFTLIIELIVDLQSTRLELLLPFAIASIILTTLYFLNIMKKYVDHLMVLLLLTLLELNFLVNPSTFHALIYWFPFIPVAALIIGGFRHSIYALSALIFIFIFNSFYANNQLGYSYTKDINIFTSSIMSFVFLAGVMASFYILYGKMGSAFFTVKQNENELKLLNEEIQEKTKETENKNAIIRSINQKLFNLNEKLNYTNENQELIIEERTVKLEQQNKVLIEYAYINSHLMRAPLARILGLSALLENQHADLKDSELFKALVQSSEELDSIIKKVSDILYEGNEISREDLESIKIKLKDQDNWPDNIE